MTERTYTVADGKVFSRGVYRDPDLCQRLLDAYRQDVKTGDWWAPHAQRLADELAACMAEADPMERAA